MKIETFLSLKVLCLLFLNSQKSSGFQIPAHQGYIGKLARHNSGAIFSTADQATETEGSAIEDTIDSKPKRVPIPPPTKPPPNYSRAAAAQQVEQVLTSTVTQGQQARVVAIKWVQDRCEVTVDVPEGSEPEAGLDVEQIHRMQREASLALEMDPHTHYLLTQIEILVATPGVSDVLQIDRDFRSFKGFEVQVTTTTILKGDSTLIMGTLIGRDEQFVKLNMKGRVVKIPRASVVEVRLPPPKFEAEDYEIRKLR